MTPLNDMALFVEVGKARGFSRAADALGMPISTLSRRITILEQTIGLRLLNRTTRRVELTEAGKIYFERCKRIVEEAKLAHEQLAGFVDNPSGTIRVSLPVDFANVYLTELITEFAKNFPGIEFEFDLTPRLVDLVAEPYDVAIRMGEPEDSGLIARLLVRLHPVLLASPEYLTENGTPQHPSDLGRHQCLFMPKSKSWKLVQNEKTANVEVQGRFAVNSNSLIRGLAANHQGIALIPAQIAAHEIARGDLVRILPGWQGAPISVYAITETRLLPAKTQRFIEFMQMRLKHFDQAASVEKQTYTS